MAYKNKEDARRWYETNKATEVQRSKRNKIVYVRRNVDYINAIKQSPCMDCGIRYPSYVMQFDHIGSDKLDHVSHLARKPVGLKKLQAEIAKCDVVCANCHSIRTHNRRFVG